MNALIGLEHGKTTSTEGCLNGMRQRSFPDDAWEKDMTLGQDHASICRSRLSGATTCALV